MSSAARSLFVFGIYAITAGVGLMMAPDIVLSTLGFPPAQDGWVRVVGTLAIFVGVYHVIAARHELLPYIRATVLVRIVLATLLTALVVSDQMPRQLLIFAVVDVAGALWTGLALRSGSSSTS